MFMFTGMDAYIIKSAKGLSSYCPTSSNDHQPMLCEGGEGAVCPGSVSAYKGQEAGITLGFCTKLEGLQFSKDSKIPIWVI